MNITLDRIVALIKKLEEEHPEAKNMVRIEFYDDLSGNFNYDVYPKEGGYYPNRFQDFCSGNGEGSLPWLLKNTECNMKARVKRIKVGTVVDTVDWSDKFVSGMYSKDVFIFLPKIISGKVCKDWYNRVVDNDWDYSYHISWLKDIQE